MFILFVFVFGVIVGLCARPVTRAILLSIAESRYNKYQTEIEAARAQLAKVSGKIDEPVASRIRLDLTMAEHLQSEVVGPLRVDENWRVAFEKLGYTAEYLASAQQYLSRTLG